MMPTGQAQTTRFIPPIAEAKPKQLPMISRQRMGEPPMTKLAFRRLLRTSDMLLIIARPGSRKNCSQGA